MGFAPVLWSVTGYDWNTDPPEKIEARVARQVRGGDVILLHDGGHLGMGAERSATVAATDSLIRRYKDQGYQFVTIPEMMKLR
jgi:peptidoglycan/xylan/chitin deacetylase (PgdA/CDA1 family)